MEKGSSSGLFERYDCQQKASKNSIEENLGGAGFCSEKGGMFKVRCVTLPRVRSSYVIF